MKAMRAEVSRRYGRLLSGAVTRSLVEEALEESLALPGAFEGRDWIGWNWNDPEPVTRIDPLDPVTLSQSIASTEGSRNDRLPALRDSGPHVFCPLRKILDARYKIHHAGALLGRPQQQHEVARAEQRFAWDPQRSVWIPRWPWPAMWRMICPSAWMRSGTGTVLK